MAYCARCGQPVPDGATACPACGYRPGAATLEAAVPPTTDGRAIAALILGIVGLGSCFLIPSIIAVVLGNQSLERIRSTPGLQGDAMARAGVILGWIGIGLSTLAFIWLVATVLI